MCLLTYFPDGVMPDAAALARGAKVNADGHGFAIVVPATDTQRARIIVRKSMKATKLIGEFQKMRELYPDGPALFHSRITTDGATNLYNCHPFMHSGDKRTVIGHNGVMPSSVRPYEGDLRSDTRIFAEEVAGFFRLHTVTGRTLAAEWMGDFNKIVILTVDPAYMKHGYIVNESSGYWDSGIWYSNTSYRESPYSKYGGRYYGNTWARKWTWCQMGCGAKAATVSPYTGICTKCRTCCLCYSVPCACALEEVRGSGKDQLPRTASNVAGGTVIGGSPAKGATVASGTGWAKDPEDYAAALESYWEILDEVGEEQARDNQLAETIELVKHLNAGGDLDDWPVSSAARTELEEMLDRGDAILVDGVISRVASPADGDEDEDGRDYLIHNGTKYMVS